MKVKLVSLTKSEIVEADLTPEELIVYIARVSNPSNQLNTETADKLLGYLIKQKHWSPFDMVNMTVEVQTSRMVAQQILRHWSIKPQEFSQRYASVVDIEPIEFRVQAVKNRQSSEEVIGSVTIKEFSYETVVRDEHFDKYDDYLDRVGQSLKNIQKLYFEGLELGASKETVRQILPLATSTTLYLNGSIRSWIHYLEQRCDLHSQKEHRLVAAQIKDIFKIHFPSISKALEI